MHFIPSQMISNMNIALKERIMISKGTLDIIKGLFMKEDSPTVMCAERSAEV